VLLEQRVACHKLLQLARHLACRERGSARERASERAREGRRGKGREGGRVGGRERERTC
jgi:hypothetical protein